MPQQTPELNQLIQKVKDIFQFIISPQLQEKIFVLKIIFIGVSILFALGIIILLIKSSYLKDALLEDLEDLSSFKDFGSKKRLKRWGKIKKKIERSSVEAKWKICLIEAQKFLDQALKEVGYGESKLDEKLRQLTQTDVSNLTQLLEAHQICQDIVRDPDYRLTKEKAQEVIDVFEKALTELGVF
jgi:preprotein translocase subunit Sss1